MKDILECCGNCYFKDPIPRAKEQKMIDKSRSLTVEQRLEMQQATAAAKKKLKRGDRIRARRCGGIKRTYSFECWDGM